jgi:hypothetical protein
MRPSGVTDSGRAEEGLAQKFPGGVRDADGRQAYAAVGSGDVAAIDLSTGAVLWRKPVGWPVEATTTRLLTLDRDGNRFVLRLLDAATGEQVRRISGFGMPDWADATPISPQTVLVDTAEGPSGIRLRWRVRRLYHGGAPPPPQIAAEARDERTGAILIDPRTGRFRSVAAPETTFGEAETKPRDLGEHATLTPDTIDLGRVGDRLFALKLRSQPGGGAEIVLEARDAHGSTLWETPIQQIERARPPPLRQ